MAAAEPEQETKRCPSCAELIEAAAIKCKHCGSVLDGDPASALPTEPQRTSDDQRTSLSGTALTGIIFFALIVVWTLAKAILGSIAANVGMLPNFLLPLWNAIVGAIMVVICVGLLRRSVWSRQWALGTSVLTLIGDGMNALQTGSLVPALAAVAGAVAAFCFWTAGREFVKTSDDAALTPSARWLQSTLSLVLIGGAILASAFGLGRGSERGRQALVAEMQKGYIDKKILGVFVTLEGTKLVVSAPGESDAQIDGDAEQFEALLRKTGANAKAWAVGFTSIGITNTRHERVLTP